MEFLSNDKLLIVGAAGMIGSNMAQTAMMMHLTPNITIYDPWANPAAVRHEYGLEVVNELPANEKFDAAIAAVAHREFTDLDITTVLKPAHVIFDVKATRPAAEVDARL